LHSLNNNPLKQITPFFLATSKKAVHTTANVEMLSQRNQLLFTEKYQKKEKTGLLLKGKQSP